MVAALLGCGDNSTVTGVLAPPATPAQMMVCDDPYGGGCEPPEPWVPADEPAVPPQSTCPDTAGIYVPSDLEQIFWANSDTMLLNRDSLWAADGYLWESASDPNALITLPWDISPSFSTTSGTMGPCEVLYARCSAVCRRLRSPKAKALCWAGCAAAYGVCLADQAVRKRGKGLCFDSREIIYDPYSSLPGESCDDGSMPVGGGGGGGGGGSGCRTEFIIVEINYNDGTGWHELWSGYASVCG